MTTKKDIESALMRGADTLRDTIDAANYKDYVLPVMFVKYLSDSYTDAVEELSKQYSGIRLERQKKYLPFMVAEGCSFYDLYQQRFADNIGQLMNAAMRQIEADNNQQLAGVLSAVDYNSENALGTREHNNAILRDLLEDFEPLDLRPSAIEVKEGQVPADVIGDAYEYMIGQFASMAGKKAGSFYTPAAVSEIMARIVNVQPGERVPIDGVIVEGASTLNTAALTGESLPRDVRSGDEVISGCVNMSGLLKVRTTKEFGESTVSKILDLVENSSMKKARTENFITRFARVYTPAVCYGALALAFVPPIVLLLMGQPARFGDWVYRALTFLVISCPCALVISIPLSFFGGIGGASACGILVKGSTYLEELARTGIVVFDKTGTLTQGTFKVVGIHPENGVTGDALVEAAALAESWSKHPISLSIKNAYGKDIDPSRVTDVQELGGHGVTAKVDGKTVAAGNARLMAKLGLTVPEITEPGTIVHVAMEGRYAGYLLIADVVKPHSAAAIKGLKQAGVRKTVMLTGDAEPVAKAVSAELGLDEYHAGLLPGDKVDRIETLLAAKQPKENLAFVGDGINDAPVLSRADVGIAMGALGSDAAIEAADVVLMDDDPAKIALAMRIARRTLRIVYQNIVFALAIKFACLVLGALGLASMWTAIFADVGVMVLAVLNATRALYTKDLAKKNVQ